MCSFNAFEKDFAPLNIIPWLQREGGGVGADRTLGSPNFKRIIRSYYKLLFKILRIGTKLGSVHIGML